MGFLALALRPLRHYADFSGRSRRSELVAFYILTTVAMLPAQYLPGLLGLEAAKPWLMGGLVAFFLVPTLALYVRRLHDWGRPGWWLLVGSPFIFAVIWEYIAYPRPFTLNIQSHLPWWAAVPVVLCVLTLYALLLWDDDVDTNRYGPNPRGWTPPQGEPA